ncbi:MAG: hypothetical protein ABIL68_14500 [bacterium]
MKPIGHILKLFKRDTYKARVFALVGKAGTGKSFRARLITEKHNIDLMIDDGLLIRGHRILAGRSAKREKNRVTAMKRAIFEDLEHAREVRRALRKEKFKSILLIGISEKMVGLIAERLYLSYPDKIIYIEDVATEEEILRAKESRMKRGKHVIPVPVIEVKQDPSQRVLDSIKLLMKTHPFFFWKKETVEKTVVQPPFSRRGRLSISEAALSQMIIHCITEYAKDVMISKILIIGMLRGYRIEVKLDFPFKQSIPDKLAGLQEYIISNIERFSGIHVEELHLTVDSVSKE